MKKINSFYVLIFLMFASLMAINTKFFKGSKSFLGITYAREYKINIERAAYVEDVYVVPGQAVQPGDLLVQLSSSELDLEIEKLHKEIEQAQSKIEERNKLLSSKLALYEAERTMIKTDRDHELAAIQNKIDLNRRLTAQLNQNINVEDSLTALQLELISIRQKAEQRIDEIDIKVLDTKQEYEFDLAQEKAVIDLAQQELDWKLREKNNLNRYASFPGVIENVYIKAGEQVEAFSSLVSINPEHPTSVVGYLVGKKERDKKLGEEVIISSLEHKELTTTAKIIGFGSVVELPDILQKSTAVKAFGLEVFLEIPESNPLPVGEKIIVK
tara:strand:- start:55779 stop:56762 length:984 start_codon:yes stop_codon:yes gene_type:complete